jgi:hypothetical protein
MVVGAVTSLHALFQGAKLLSGSAGRCCVAFAAKLAGTCVRVRSGSALVNACRAKPPFGVCAVDRCGPICAATRANSGGAAHGRDGEGSGLRPALSEAVAHHDVEVLCADHTVVNQRYRLT